MPTALIELSDYAVRHPDHYALRPTMWQAGRPTNAKLTLMDREGEFIDEGGCNCDLDRPCNNPKCVMERDRDGLL